MCLENITLAGKLEDNNDIVFDGYKLFKTDKLNNLYNWNNGIIKYYPDKWYLADTNGDDRIHGMPISGYVPGFHLFSSIKEADIYNTNRKTNVDVLQIKCKNILAIGTARGAKIIVAQYMMIPSSLNAEFFQRNKTTISDIGIGERFKFPSSNEVFTRIDESDHENVYYYINLNTYSLRSTCIDLRVEKVVD
jgi:hypothetical protein